MKTPYHCPPARKPISWLLPGKGHTHTDDKKEKTHATKNHLTWS